MCLMLKTQTLIFEFLLTAVGGKMDQLVSGPKVGLLLTTAIQFELDTQ
jgi:hypothetical protein